MPALPEVVTEGNSEEEALAMAKEALEYRRDHGMDIPEDTAPEIRAVYLAAAA